MSPRTLGMWLAMSHIDPWDENRADLRAAEIASTVANSQGASKKDGTPITPADFMPYAEMQIDPDELADMRAREADERLRRYLMNLSARKET